MGVADWFRVDPAAGAVVSDATIRRSLMEGGLAAVAVGSLIHFVMILAFAEDGQGLLIIPAFDWMLAPVWGAVFVLFGLPAARAALAHGRFGLPHCVLFGIGVVFGVMWPLIAVVTGDASRPNSWPLALHFGLVHGSVAGLVFWLTLTTRHPALLPLGVSEARPLGAVLVGLIVLAGIFLFLRV